MAKRKNHYVDNKELLAEIVLYKKTGVCSERLGGMLLTTAQQYSSLGRFSGYTWKQDMISTAVLTCIKYLKNFNPERSSNAFAYVTQIIKNAFKLTIIEEKKLGKIKDICFKSTLLSNPLDDMSFAQKSIDYEDVLRKVPEYLVDGDSETHHLYATTCVKKEMTIEE